MNSLIIKKLNPSAHIQKRTHPGDLGYDLFSIEQTRIGANSVGKVRTGIAVQFPEGYGGFIKDRSSLASMGLSVCGGVIDSGYRGELVVIFANHGMTSFPIDRGMKIAQMIPIKVMNWSLKEVDELGVSDRGNNGFGSTGSMKKEIVET